MSTVLFHKIASYCNTQTAQLPHVHFKISDHELRQKVNVQVDLKQ